MTDFVSDCCYALRFLFRHQEGDSAYHWTSFCDFLLNFLGVHLFLIGTYRKAFASVAGAPLSFILRTIYFDAPFVLSCAARHHVEDVCSRGNGNQNMDYAIFGLCCSHPRRIEAGYPP